eukprot:scaffold17616_cov99-Isochrysis_galbana.AAC.1
MGWPRGTIGTRPWASMTAFRIGPVSPGACPGRATPPLLKGGNSAAGGCAAGGAGAGGACGSYREGGRFLCRSLKRCGTTIVPIRSTCPSPMAAKESANGMLAIRSTTPLCARMSSTVARRMGSTTSNRSTRPCSSRE